RALFRSGSGSGAGARFGAWALLAIHLLMAPLLLVVGIAALSRMARGTERVEATMMDYAPPLPKRAYVIAASDPMGPFYASAERAVRRPGEVDSFEILSMAKRTHRITRTDASTLRIETLDGSFLDGGFCDVFRARRLGMHAGEVVPLDGARVRVVADDAGA